VSAGTSYAHAAGVQVQNLSLAVQGQQHACLPNRDRVMQSNSPIAGTHDINAYSEQDQLYSLAAQGQQLATLLNQSMQVAVPHDAAHLQV